MVSRSMKKLKLHGFNNLTKTLSFNIYDICYAKTRRKRTGAPVFCQAPAAASAGRIPCTQPANMKKSTTTCSPM